MISEEIMEKLIEHEKGKIKQWPCNSNRASEIGHPCERYLVYLRTSWQKKALHDVGLQFRFDEGNLHERAMIALLLDAGFDIVEQQRPFEWKEYQITGHVDGKLVWKNQILPFDIKSMSRFVFDTIHTVEDMKNGKYVYLRKYPTQLYLYCLMDNKDLGLFITKNKESGWPKIIEVPLDYEFAESVLQKTERVNKHLENNTLPEHCKMADVCLNCSFRHICLPSIGGEGIEFMENGLAELLTEREDLQEKIDKSNIAELNKRLTQINKDIKKITEGKNNIVAGKWYLSGKWIERKGYQVKDSKYWSVDIAKME